MLPLSLSFSGRIFNVSTCNSSKDRTFFQEVQEQVQTIARQNRVKANISNYDQKEQLRFEVGTDGSVRSRNDTFPAVPKVFVEFRDPLNNSMYLPDEVPSKPAVRQAEISFLTWCQQNVHNVSEVSPVEGQFALLKSLISQGNPLTANGARQMKAMLDVVS